MGPKSAVGESSDLPPNAFPDSNEIRFGKHLASNDKPVRDAAVAALELWLSKRKGLQESDFLKIWKGLFYCMWMCDKVPIQMELADRLTAMVHLFPTAELAMGWFGAALRTLQREWAGLDHLRLDKYYAFARKAVRQALVWAGRRGWAPDPVAVVTGALAEEVLARVPNGLRFHLCDLFLAELHAAAAAAGEGRGGGGGLGTIELMQCLEPFYEVLCTTNDKMFFKRAKERIFQDLLDFIPKQIDDADNDQMSDSGEAEQDEAQTLKFEMVNFEAIQAWIFEAASSEETSERYRETLYELHKQYQSVTGIEFARNIEKLVEDGAIVISDATEGLAGSEEESAKQRKTPKNKKRKNSKDEPVAAASETPSTETIGKKKKRRKKSSADTTPSPAEEEEKKANQTEEVEQDIPVLSKTKKKKSNDTTKKERKAIFDLDNEAMEKSDPPEPPTNKKKLKSKSRMEGTNGNSDEQMSSSNQSSEKVGDKSKKKAKGKAGGLENALKELSTMFTPEKDNKQLKKKEKAPETPSCQKKLKELDFIASKKFKGARPGYAFKKGNKGLGYYVDVIPTSQISANKKKRRSGGARNKKQSPGGKW